MVSRGLRFAIAVAALGLVPLASSAQPRYRAGSLDRSFGHAGQITTAFPGWPTVIPNAVAIQRDGKIVLAGEIDNFDLRQSELALARYNANGTLDQSFGSAGRVTMTFGSDRARALALSLQADGKLIAVGLTAADDSHAQFAVARFNGDGSLDTSFGNGGKVVTDFGQPVSWAGAVAGLPDRKIVVAGIANGEFALARYNPDGSLDPSFGTGGKVTTAFGPDAAGVDALALQGNGKIVAAGWSGTASTDEVFALARYNADGSLDPTFGSGGKVRTGFFGDASASTLLVQPDGKIVAVGANQDDPSTFALARYNRNGSLDPNFGSDGKVETSIFGAPYGGWAGAGLLQRDGKIVAVGSASSGNGDELALARYNRDGSLDRSFGGWGGESLTTFGMGIEADAAALQPNGRIVVAGTADKPPGTGFGWEILLARYFTKAPECVVPSVVGKERRIARNAVLRRNCTTHTHWVYSDAGGRGRVIEQSPKPGTKVRAGKKVYLLVSNGRRRASAS